MDIEEFYDTDPRRRASREFEFGREWSDADGNRRAVSWVEDTGELYVMAEPMEPIINDQLFGDEHLAPLPVAAVTVEVLGIVPSLDAVEALVGDWHERMLEPASLDQLRRDVTTGHGAARTVEPPDVLPGG